MLRLIILAHLLECGVVNYNLVNTKLVTRVIKPRLLQNELAQIFVKRFYLTHGTASDESVNRYFTFLLTQNKFFLTKFGVNSFFLYNFWARELVARAAAGLANAALHHKKILFVCDKQTDAATGFLALNFLFWPKTMAPVFDIIGKIHYYYNYNARQQFQVFFGSNESFDLAIFCGKDYGRVNVRAMKSVARLTLGVCPSNTRPDLFDYAIPVVNNYYYTAAWVAAIVLFFQSKPQYF